MPSYVKFETPKEVVDGVVEALSVAKDSGRIRKGINETTKSIERKAAKLVVLAADVEPEEIIIHIPMLCEEKGIPYVYVPTKADLGAAVGLPVPTSSVAVEDAGGAKEILSNVLKRLPKAKAEEKAPEKKEEKPAEAEAPKEEKPKKEKKPRKRKKKEKAPEEKKEEKPAEESPKEEKKEEAPKEEKKEEAPKEEKAPEEKKEEKPAEEAPKEEKKEEKAEASEEKKE